MGDINTPRAEHEAGRDPIDGVDVQLPLWGELVGRRESAIRGRRRPRLTDPHAAAVHEVIAGAVAWADLLLHAADRERRRTQEEVEDEVIEWLDEAHLERARLVESATREAARIVAEGEAARRSLINQGREEAERRVAAGDRLAEEFLAEADAERDAILSRAADEASRLRAEADAVLGRSLEEADRERTRAIAAAREEIVALRADADQSLKAETAQIIDRARLEADTIRVEADRHALVVRAEAAAAFARRVEAAVGPESAPQEDAATRRPRTPPVEGFIGSGLRSPSTAERRSGEGEAEEEQNAGKPRGKSRRGLGRLLLRARS